MITPMVVATGIVFELGADGWYQVTHWVRLQGALSAETHVFESLSWAEAQDVAGACVTAARPGWAHGDGWTQPPLFGPGTDRD